MRVPLTTSAGLRTAPRYGFVEFEDSRDADDAVYELNGKELCGERVIVEHARGPRRDRDGYSYGSRSESQPRALRVLGTLRGGRGGASQPGQARWPGSIDYSCLRALLPSRLPGAATGRRSAGIGLWVLLSKGLGIFFMLIWDGVGGGLCWAPVSTVVSSARGGSEGWL